MKRKRSKIAAQSWAAIFLLILGIIIPSLIPRGRMDIPVRVGWLLVETLAEERDPARQAFVQTACALTDQVDYFWGGKSRALGWDRAWGWPRRVTSAGSRTTGQVRPYGLDCSGLVSWAAASALKDPAAYDKVGEGAWVQYARCVPTQVPRPGDLAFFPDISHVGIVLGRDREGMVWVVHCSASLGGVVVTPETVGFTLYGTPSIFSKESLWDFPIDK